MKNNPLLFALVLTLGLYSCSKPGVDQPVIDPVLKTMGNLVIPNTFSFETTHEISIGILVKNSSMVLSNVPVSIYLDYPGNVDASDSKARLIGTFISQSDGRIDLKLKLPVTQDSLYLKTNYIGLESEAGFPIIGSNAYYKYGDGHNLKSAPVTSQKKAAFAYHFLGTFSSQGLPNYLEPVRDDITQDLLDVINASLPEYKHLPISHPQYMLKGNEADLIIKEQADVWITFVSEGANYLNAVGYYTYDAVNPPRSISDISKFNIIFPNTSLGGSGGAMKSGDKVFLGRFNAGQAIGWFMVANGWKSGTVTNPPTYFSDPALNPETNIDNRQHTVLLYDNLRGLLIMGFEDLIRNTSISSDEDFNDALFYITASPVKAIEVNKVPSVDTPLDDDKDGVSNSFDEFPKDPKRAYTNYYPAKNQYNSLIIEDLWPSLGDFDFNDLVLDCQYKQVNNAQANVVEMFIKLKVRAIGASYKNGFGIQFPFVPSLVSLVTLTDQTGAIKNIGLESGQTQAVVIAFNDACSLLPSTGGSGVNVIPGNGWKEPNDIEIHLVFATPQPVINIGTAPFNPFVIINGDRSKEIHLANAIPTNKANAAFFGQGDDSSNPATSRYYKSKTNLVWILEVPSSFAYAIETKSILKTYLNFGQWAESGGAKFNDWYLDIPGYRENSNIYNK